MKEFDEKNDLMPPAQQSEMSPHYESQASIFEKLPSKRKLIRDTKNIKVSFGNYQSNLLGPRADNVHRIPST